MPTSTPVENLTANVTKVDSDHDAIKNHFRFQTGRPDIRTLWQDSMGTRYRVNFYVPEGYGLVQCERQIASYMVLVHEGLVVDKTIKN